jgi:hypothetical protein
MFFKITLFDSNTFKMNYNIIILKILIKTCKEIYIFDHFIMVSDFVFTGKILYLQLITL